MNYPDQESGLHYQKYMGAVLVRIEIVSTFGVMKEYLLIFFKL